MFYAQSTSAVISGQLIRQLISRNVSITFFFSVTTYGRRWMARQYRKITTSVAWQSIHFKGWSGRGGRGGNVERKKGSDNMVYNEMCIPQNTWRIVDLSPQKKRLWQHGIQWNVHPTKHTKDCWSFSPEEKAPTTWYTMKCASRKHMNNY